MAGFFGPTGPSFTPYSQQHIAALMITAGLLLILYIYRRSLRKPPLQAAFRLGLAGMLFLLYAALQLWYITAGAWSWNESLPLQLCTVCLLLSVVLMITRSYPIYEFVYFAGIGGALQALFTPVLDVGFPHFWYVYFFVGHGGIIAAALFMTFVEGYRPKPMSIVRSLMWVNVLLLVVYPVNRLTGANYMFVSRKPQTASLLDLLGPWPWYLLALEGVALLLFVMLYLPFAFTRKDSEKNNLT